MNKSYYEILPRDYFDGLYEKTAKALERGENVLVSAMYGCGGKTFVNFFLHLARRDKMFENVYYLDPEVVPGRLDLIVKKLAGRAGKTVVIIRFFEKVGEKSKLLERLHRLRISQPHRLMFLVVTDHSGIVDSQDYVAETTPFFSERFVILPFGRKQAGGMIDITCMYYGWQIKKDDWGRVIELSGGVPRLVKYICKEASERRLGLNKTDYFLTSQSVVFELDYMARLLVKLGLTGGRMLGLVDEKGKIVSQLLVDYYKRFQDEFVARLYPNLSKLETKVLSFLYVNRGRVVDLEKLGDLMEMGEDDYSLWAIYKLISRLRPKVEKNFEIKNIKGRGYLLGMR